MVLSPNLGRKRKELVWVLVFGGHPVTHFERHVADYLMHLWVEIFYVEESHHRKLRRRIVLQLHLAGPGYDSS
jgi:hypothetical protein